MVASNGVSARRMSPLRKRLASEVCEPADGELGVAALTVSFVVCTVVATKVFRWE